MAEAESRRVLTSGLPAMPTQDLEELIELTGRWPLLLSLANGALRRSTRDKASVTEAAHELIRRLRAEGPATLNITIGALRNQAVDSVIGTSLSLLTAAQRKRYFELAIFNEERDIPTYAVGILWKSEGLREDVETLCEDLFELSLIASHDAGKQTIRLHSVLRAYLRHSLGSDGLRSANHRFISEVRKSLVDEQEKARTETAYPWWDLPHEATYLWQNLCYHLHEAGNVYELTRLVSDLRWTEKRIQLQMSAVLSRI